MTTSLSTLRTKRPDDRIDFDVDFRRWLSSGDTITGAEVEVSEGGVTVDDFDFTEQVVKVWLADGEIGETVHVTVTVTTEHGRTKEVCFKVRVKESC